MCMLYKVEQYFRGYKKTSDILLHLISISIFLSESTFNQFTNFFSRLLVYHEMTCSYRYFLIAGKLRV